MKIAWLSPYNVTTLEPELSLARHLDGHSCSWIVTLSEEIALYPDIDLHIITESPLVNKTTIVRKGGITFHVIKSGIPFTNRGYPPYFNLEILTAHRFNVRRLVAEVKRLNPDIVHAYGTERGYSLAAYHSNYPCLITIQGVMNLIAADSHSRAAKTVKESERFVVSKAKYFDCRTNLDTGFVKELNEKAHIFEIHHAIHPDFFAESWQVQNEHSILFVGSVIKRKGIEILLLSLGQLLTQFPGLSLTIVGGVSVEYQAHLEEIAAAQGLIGKIRFAGFLSQKEIAAAHMRHQILAYPSFAENSPNGVAEAMVSGLPVVVSSVGGVPSMIEDNVTGLLVEPSNVDSLTEALKSLLDNPEKRQALSFAAREIAHMRHKPAKVGAKLMKAYQKILDDKK
ncbi:MAG: glycosyltransferase family 4 protein [Calditrichia bacterium]